MNRLHMIFFGVSCIMLITPFARSAEQASKEQAKAIKRMELLDHQRRLKPWDVVSIRIVEDKREALFQTVDRTGEMQCPYTGLMSVAGLTCRDVAFRCKSALEKNFFRTATVLVLLTDKFPPEQVLTTRCPGPDYLVAHGKVLKPGKYDFPYDRDITVSEFLKRAGGPISRREVPRIQIVRHTPKGNKRILVNSRAVLIEKRKEFDLFLRWEDVVIVE